MEIFSLDRARSAAVDLYLRHLARPMLTNPDWHLSASELRNVRIRWPRSYQWDQAADWVGVIRTGLKSSVPVEIVDDIPQEYKGTVVFQIYIGGWRTIAISYSDYGSIDEGCIRGCDLVLKMQYEHRGYGSGKVIPGGYVPGGKRLYYYLPRLRAKRDRTKSIDVYGRFSLNYAREIRERATAILSEQDRVGFAGGMKTVGYGEFLNEVACSKVCIDLPGLGSLCFRLINYLAVGSCIVAYPHTSKLHVPLVDREHIVYCKEDFSDLVELCEYYVRNDEERERIASNARRYFDLYLHKDNLVRYYLRMMLDQFC